MATKTLPDRKTTARLSGTLGSAELVGVYRNMLLSRKIDDKEVQSCLRVTLADGLTDAGFLVDLLMAKGLRLKTFKEEEINLEKVFLDITKGITN